MPIDKSWTTNPKRKSPEFEQGLESFAKICQEHADSRGYVRCVCQRCHNTILLPMHLMKHHMRVFGFSRLYKTWCYHGETSDVDDVAPRNDTVVDDVAPRNDMIDVIEDVMEEVMEEDSNIDEGNLDTESIGVCDDFEDLLKEVQSELYPGCAKFSSLDFLAKLMHIKVNHKWTNSSFDELLELLQSSYPEGNKIPSSHYVAKKTLKKIGLGYESIHVCRNDCALFWKEYSSLQNCPVCNESRWINEKTKGKKIAHKVLRYFPVTPRLRRLYCSRHTAKDMIWHSIGRSEEGTMRHPVDGSSWKEFDKNYPNFSREPRNVRLGLAADGFNPYGNMSSIHSTWPVILTIYNLPPWLCMKETSFMLSLLIPGPKSPGKDMDVFLRPLVEELKQLWQTGVRTKDAATNTFFTMKAALLWTINDYPARSSLSGWSGQGYKACPTCNEDTPSVSVTNKIVYVGHRRFLAANHPLRKNLNFNGKQEIRPPPRQFSNADIKAQLDRLLFRKPGKHPEFGLKEPDRQDFELNWSKRSIFFELEYWSSLQLKHNLDVMHVEKNVCCSLLSTLLMNDKTKDTSNARSDLEKLNIRRPQWLHKRGNKFFRPQAKYSFTNKDRELFCQFVKDIKLPDGFGSNISSKVSDNNKNITALKSHDYHIIMQRLMPIGVRGFLNKDTYTPIVDLCMFFKQLCSRTLLVKDMKKAKNDVLTILCKLELIYPPAFFDIMIHLVLHLPDEALCGGPVYMRWMYPFERYMKKLKNYVRNKARPEGCMAEGYVAEEALTFCVPARRKTRGKAKNLELSRHHDKTGRKMTLEFDRATTYTPVGRPYDLFVREVGIYMWNNMPFNRKDWKSVTKAEKDALINHLKRRFDFDVIEDDCERLQLTGGIDSVLMKRYRDRKSDAKVEFDDAGGYKDIDRARTHPPEGMTLQNWNKAIDFFCTPEYRRRSDANKGTRQKQQYTNRGGTSTYSSACYKTGRKRIEQFKKAHTRKDGTWDSDVAYQQYLELEREFHLLNDPSPEPSKEVAVFEKVLGSRRGHYKGIGRKPPVTATIPPHFDVGQSSQEAPTKDTLAQMLEDPRHRDALAEFLRTYTPGHGGGTSKGVEDTQGDGGDQDDQNVQDDDDDLE
ncbi:hypothetical protein L2E82_13955 [Cichorium intybus]|uniref:Uncharacterized protein n=1 Tax=Cichorium intybus TaxID=13427 RepID=A0ACB9EYN1_CICIN|nr:hypothetical protein L2E82_13955 [Cichorium intybus]